jgi:hypothetical protein
VGVEDVLDLLWLARCDTRGFVLLFRNCPPARPVETAVSVSKTATDNEIKERITNLPQVVAQKGYKRLKKNNQPARIVLPLSCPHRKSSAVRMRWVSSFSSSSGRSTKQHETTLNCRGMFRANSCDARGPFFRRFWWNK